MSGENGNLEFQIRAKNLTQEAFDKVQQALKALEDQQQHNNEKSTAFSKYLEELDPRANTAAASFKNLKGTLTELWENPTQGAKDFAGALATDLTTGLGMAAIAVGLVVAALAVAGTVMFELADKAAAVGGNLNDMGEKTGIVVPALSRLSNASRVAGTDINTLSNAVFIMQKNMAESPDRFEKGLEKIGLHFKDFKALSPDEQLLAVADALKKTEDPVDRNSAGFEMMGRQFRDLVPSLLKMNEALAMTADIRPWTDEEARDAEAFEMQIASMKVHLESMAIIVGRELIPPMITFFGLTKDFTSAILTLTGNISGITSTWHLLTTEWAYAAVILRELRGQHEQLPISMDDVEKRIKVLTATNAELVERGYKPSIQSAFDLSVVTKDLDDKAKASIETNQKVLEEKKKYLESLDNIVKAERGYNGVLNDINGTVIESIRFDLQHKASMEDIARVYGLTKEQVKLVEQALKDEDAAAKTAAETAKKLAAEVLKIEGDKHAFQMNWVNEFSEAERKATQAAYTLDAKTIGETQKLEETYYDNLDQMTLNATDYALAQQKRKYDDQVAKARAAGVVDQTYYDWLALTNQQAMDKILLAHNKLFQDEQQLLSDIAGGEGGWSDTFAKILVETHSFKDAANGVWDLLKAGFKNVLSDMLSLFLKDFLGAMTSKLAGFLAGLIGGKGGSSSSGWLSALLGLIGGGGGSSTPITSGYFDSGGNWVPMPGVPGGEGAGPGGLFPVTPENPNHESRGGTISYLKDGGWPFTPIGTDVVPAMLTPGEGIVNVGAMEHLGRAGLDHLNRGGSVGAFDTSALERHAREQTTLLKRLSSNLERMFAAQPTMLRDAILLSGAAR